MSRIADLGDNYQHLPAMLQEYDQYLDDASNILSLKGKTIGNALQEQGSWPAFYDERRRELNTLVKFFDMKVAACRGELLKAYTENYSRELGERAKDKYIDNEPAYHSIYQLYLEVFELAEKYTAVVDAFKLRGFALRDISLLRVNEIENGLL